MITKICQYSFSESLYSLSIEADNQLFFDHSNNITIQPFCVKKYFPNIKNRQ